MLGQSSLNGNPCDSAGDLNRCAVTQGGRGLCKWPYVGPKVGLYLLTTVDDVNPA